MNSKEFVEMQDMNQINRNAAENISDGPITKTYTIDPNRVNIILNALLATEISCALRYKSHYYKAKSLGYLNAAKEFLEHSIEEQAHADQLANRIAQLGCSPQMSPHAIISHSHIRYEEGDNLDQMLEFNLVAERAAVDTYRQAIQLLGNADPTTRRLLEDILAKEEEHVDDLLEVAAECKNIFNNQGAPSSETI